MNDENSLFQDLKTASHGKTLLSMIEASNLSCISVSTLRRRIISGDLKYLRPYGRYLIRLMDLAEFLTSGQEKSESKE